jgi:hypothetical protein
VFYYRNRWNARRTTFCTKIAHFEINKPYDKDAKPTSLAIWANQLIHSYLVGCLNPSLRGTSVRVGSPQPSVSSLRGIDKHTKFTPRNQTQHYLRSINTPHQHKTHPQGTHIKTKHIDTQASNNRDPPC